VRSKDLPDLNSRKFTDAELDDYAKQWLRYTNLMDAMPKFEAKNKMIQEDFAKIHGKATQMVATARTRLSYLTPLNPLVGNDREYYFTTVFDIVKHYPRGSQDLDSRLDCLVKDLLGLYGGDLPQRVDVAAKDCYNN
jgi:hypothetical protein